MPLGRVEGWVNVEECDQLSMTQKHLNIAQRTPAVQGWGVEGCRRDLQVKTLFASDSMEKTTERPWFHGMWTARKKVSALSRAGCSTESLMRRIVKRI